MVKIIDCIYFSSLIKERIRNKVKENNLEISIAIILIGENKASLSYVSRKIEVASSLNIKTDLIRFNFDISEKEVIDIIERLNQDKKTTGILLQLPISKHLNLQNILKRISPEKDIDGLHYINSGLLNTVISKNDIYEIDLNNLNEDKELEFGVSSPVIPATALGVNFIINNTIKNLESKQIVIFGDSNLVTRPLARLMLIQKATVVILNSKSVNISHFLENADVIILATGIRNLLKIKDISNSKKLSLIIDIGVSFDENNKICGDLSKEFYQVKEMDTFNITKVPNGIGPITIASLMYNALMLKLTKKDH